MSKISDIEDSLKTQIKAQANAHGLEYNGRYNLRAVAKFFQEHGIEIVFTTRLYEKLSNDGKFYSAWRSE